MSEPSWQVQNEHNYIPGVKPFYILHWNYSIQLEMIKTKKKKKHLEVQTVTPAARGGETTRSSSAFH